MVIEVRDHAHGLEIKQLLEEKYENLFWNSEAVYDKKWMDEFLLSHYTYIPANIYLPAQI